jgi:hypothetical protein
MLQRAFGAREIGMNVKAECGNWLGFCRRQIVLTSALLNLQPTTIIYIFGG